MRTVVCVQNELSQINHLPQVEIRTVDNFRPLCPVRLNGQPSYALIDSGNVVVNAISEKFAKELFGPDLTSHVEFDSRYTRIGTAEEGAKLKVLGVTVKPVILRFGGCPTQFLTKPVVIEGLSMDVNISGPFLSEHGIDQIHSKGSIRVRGKLIRLTTYRRKREKDRANGILSQIPWDPGRLRRPPEEEEAEVSKNENSAQTKEWRAYVAKNCTVPPRSALFVPLYVPERDRVRGEEEEGTVRVCQHFADRIQGHPALEVAVILSKTGDCYSSVLNLTNKDVDVKEGTLFGKYHQQPSTETSLNHIGPRIRPKWSKESRLQKETWLVKEFRLKEAPWLQKHGVYDSALKLLVEYYDIMSHDDEYGKTHLVQHEIKTQDIQPIRLKGRPINPVMQEKLKEQMDTWKKQGVIEKSSSPWSFGLIPVQKKNGKVRWVVDYRRLNDVTLKDAHPLPNMEDNIARLAHSRVFSAIDGAGAFHAISIKKEDREKTAFHTPWGLWQFKQMPFGLCNAPATYSRLVQRVLEDVPTSIALPYLDDTCIHSRNVEDHLKALKIVFEAHRKAGLMLQPSKCHLFQTSVEYLGHVISAKGVQPRESYGRCQEVTRSGYRCQT